MIAKDIIFNLHQRGIVLAKDGDELVLTGATDKLTEQDIVAIKGLKGELLALLGGQSQSLGFVSRITQAHYEAPLSNLQRNMHFLESLSQGQSYYNVPSAFTLRGEVDEQALAKAVAHLCQHYHILRTVYQYRGDELVQVVEPFEQAKVPFTVASIDEADVNGRLKQQADWCFDLAQHWPLNVVLFKTAKASYLSLNLHHIAVDGYSAKLITKALSEAYQGFLPANAAEKPRLNEAPQYADYAYWHQDYLVSNECEQARSYWQQLLKGAPSCHHFPLEFARPSELSVAGDVIYRHIEGSLFDKLKQAAQAKNLSVFLLLQSLFAGFMARFGDEEDLVIGSVYANRTPSAFINTVGMFANTIPFRYRFDGDTDVNHLIASTVAQHQKALRFQSFPFEMMLNGLNIERDVSYNPLVQVAFVLQEDSLNDFSLSGLDVEMRNNRQAVSKFDFAAHVYVTEQRLTLQWEYNTSLFSQARSQAIIEHFLVFAEHHLQHEFEPVLKFCFADVERHRVSPEHFADYISNPELIEQYGEKTPQAIAVSDGEQSLTYLELISRGQRFIAGLQQLGIKSGERVAVYMEKSIEQVIAMYGVMRAGFVYVPLDPSYPQERLAYMCENADIKALVHLAGAEPPFDMPSQAVLAEFTVLGDCNKPAVLDTLYDEHPAYIIYTSGSTGKPKGVMVPHGSIYYSLQANRQVYDFKPQDNMPTLGSQAFGVSLLETFVPLISGGTVLATGKAVTGDIARLIEATAKVTVMHMVPSLMAQWLDQIENDPGLYPELRLLLVGAEPVPPILLSRLKAWRPDVVVRVLYGMTESSVVSSSYLSDDHDGNGYSVGKPHPNMMFYTMNRFGVRQPVGVPGELYLGGLSLASGYVGLPQLSDEKFIYHKALQQRLYKTGDRARLLASGHFEYLGRTDHQVSLRGIRIETGEIESLLDQLSDVKKCIAHVVALDNGESKFVLYYTQYGQQTKDELEAQIKGQLAKEVPESMRPTVFVALEQFPLNPNGKVDRKKLPKPTSQSAYVAPQDDYEQYVHNLWCEMLELERISVIDNFFELGGHSLMATKLINQINDVHHIQLPLRLFYEAATIRACAKVIAQQVTLRDLGRTLMQQALREITGEIDEFVV